MNEILKLKKNHPPTSDAIGKILDRHVSATHSDIQRTETQLAEDEEKIKQLSLLLSAAQEKLAVDKIALEDKTKQLNAENQKLKELEAEKGRIKLDKYNLEKKCHRLRTNKRNPQDQQILNLGQKKWSLYKQLTRIRWDFDIVDPVTKGLVSDKKSYIRTFCFPNDMESEELSEKLWREIELSTENKSHDDDEEKENSSINV